MKYYHLTAVCFDTNRATLEAAFHAVKPGNNLSQNWNQFATECVVKAPEVECVGQGVLAIYDDPPVSMTTSTLWRGTTPLGGG